jgi:hypothetical protein
VKDDVCVKGTNRSLDEKIEEVEEIELRVYTAKMSSLVA